MSSSASILDGADEFSSSVELRQGLLYVIHSASFSRRRPRSTRRRAADVRSLTSACLLESLVELGSSERRPPDPLDVVHPATVIDGAIRRLRGLLAGRVVRRYVAADAPPVHVHVSQMERALTNLLQNAIKYTPSGTPIDISIRITQNEELLLLVEDRGPGAWQSVTRSFCRMADA